MDSINYTKLTVVKLKVELVKRDLDTKGRKAALIKRLEENDAAAIPDQVSKPEAADANVDDDDDDGKEAAAPAAETSEAAAAAPIAAPIAAAEVTLTPIERAFSLAQMGSKAHAKLVMKLLKVRRDSHMAGENFFSQFVVPVHRLLVVKQRAPAVERCVEFVWKFATACKKNDQDDEDEEDFACQLIRHLLQYHNAKDSSVRFRVCQIVAATFNNLDEEAEIEDDLWDNVVDCMVKRCQDKTVAVRAQATSCLRRLHEPEEQDNDATQVLLTLMNTDKAKEVRRVALSCLGISRYTLPHIVTRTRDEEPSVRRKALEVLSSFDRLLEVLSISQRVRLVEQSLRDRDDTVSSFAREMIATRWLPKCGDDGGYDVLELLSKFDVLNEESVGLLIINALLRTSSEADAHPKLIAAVRIAPIMEKVQYWQVKEASLLWRAQCENAMENNDHAGLEDRLHMGSIVGFCDVLKQNLPTPDAPSTEDRDYVCRQMLLQAKLLEFGHDEAGRVELNRLLSSSVYDKSTPESLVSLAIEALMCTHCGNEDDYLWSMMEMISNVTDTDEEVEGEMGEVGEVDESSLKKNKYIQTLIQQVQEKREEMTQCVRDENFALAQSLKMDIGDLEDEIVDLEGDIEILGGKDWGLQRGLSIAEPMLRRTRMTLKQSPTLEGIWGSLLLPALSSEFPSVRMEVAKCIGLYALLDPTGEQGTICMPLLMRMSTYDMFEVQVAAIQAMFDLVMIFPSLAQFEDDQEETEENKSKDPIDIMLSFLKSSDALTKNDDDNDVDGDDDDDDDSAEIRHELTIKMTTVVAEGLARLMYNGRTRRTDVMEQLLLLFFGKSGAVSKLLAADSASMRSKSDPLFRARQCLHMFFPQFAIHSHVNQQIIERSGLSTFRTMMQDKDDQDMNDSLIEGYIKFLAFYLQERQTPSKEEIAEQMNVSDPLPSSFHGRLMVNLLSDLILANASRRRRCHMNNHHAVLCKSLSKLKVPSWDVVGRSLVQHLCGVCVDGSDDHGKWSAIDKKNVTRPLKSLLAILKKEVTVAAESVEESEGGSEGSEADSSVLVLSKEDVTKMCDSYMGRMQMERDTGKKMAAKKVVAVMATTQELDEVIMSKDMKVAEEEKKVKKTKRKIKSKTKAASSSFNLDDDFDEYSSGRSSSGSNKSSSRRISSPLAATRKRVTAASPPEVDENMKRSVNVKKKAAAVKIEAYEPPAAPAVSMVSSQPTKDQMLAEIDNLLSDDSDSD